MLNFKKVAVAGGFAMCTLLPVVGSASNGLFALGYGARQVGIAGGGVAFPQDALIAAINPAGVVFVSEQMEIDIQYFSPSREYTVSGTPGKFAPFPGAAVKSDSENFFIPSFALSHVLDNKSSLGFAMYGNGGMNTDYASHDTPFGMGTFGGDHTGVNYAQIFANLNYSREFAEGHASWGVSAIFNYSYLRMDGLSGFANFSEDSSHLSDEGYDQAFGFGLRVGILGEAVPGITLAASYQTEIKNTFDDYKGLFINSGEFDIPAIAQVGVAADVGPGTFTLDIQQIQYSDVDAIGNTSASLLTGSKLGDNVGFGWDNMTVYKMGYTWKANDDWTWRVGASYGEQPIPDEEVTFSILATGVMEYHYTAGFSKKLESGSDINVALMYAPGKRVKGADLFTPTNTVELCMDQLSVNAGYSF